MAAAMDILTLRRCRGCEKGLVALYADKWITGVANIDYTLWLHKHIYALGSWFCAM